MWDSWSAQQSPPSAIDKSNIRMIKLYLKTNSAMRYHEAWISGSKVVEHWGVVGDRGESREHTKDRKKSDEENILDVLADPLAKGFLPIDDDGFDVLMIEYAIDGMGNKKDLKKRHDLEDRMNETLGWTGLGNCDGGSTWSEIPLVSDAKVREFGIAFLDENIGWVGAVPNGFQTTDGGVTWQAIEMGNAVNKIRLLKYDSQRVGYAIGVNVYRIDIPSK